jgi:hypothetical protein
MVEDSPYRPPASDVTARPCPVCGGGMQAGGLHSIGSIRWFGAAESRLKKFLGGNPLSHKAGAGGRVPGHRCVGCRLILVQDQER